MTLKQLNDFAQKNDINENSDLVIILTGEHGRQRSEEVLWAFFKKNEIALMPYNMLCLGEAQE